MDALFDPVIPWSLGPCEARSDEPSRETPELGIRLERSGSIVRPGSAVVWGLLLTICGCGYDTSIYGIYFPSWIIAPVLGAGLAALTLSAFSRSRLAAYVPSGLVMFSAVTLIFAVLLWALFFDA